jgi:hypothetical protein
MTWQVGDTVYVVASAGGIWRGVVEKVFETHLAVACLTPVIPVDTRPPPERINTFLCFSDVATAISVARVDTLGCLNDLELEYLKHRAKYEKHLAALAAHMEGT